MKDDVAQEREDGDESDEIESQEAEAAIQSRDEVSGGRLISEGGVINSIIITRSAFSNKSITCGVLWTERKLKLPWKGMSI